MRHFESTGPLSGTLGFSSDVTHVLWVILHVEYDGDGLLTIRVRLDESR